MKPADLTDEQRDDVLKSIAREVSREVMPGDWDRERTGMPEWWTEHDRRVNEAADRGDALRAQLELPDKP